LCAVHRPVKGADLMSPHEAYRGAFATSSPKGLYEAIAYIAIDAPVRRN